MAGLSTGAGAPTVKVYHEKSMILPDVSRVLACLYEKDVKFECVKDSYKDILRLQASRSVPVPFYDGPTFLQESRAICRYIAETYEQRGYPFLLGNDVLERASIEQWLRHEEHAFDPPSRALFCHLAFPLHDEDNDDINREKRKLEEVLAVYEQRLGESEFLAGDKFTLADLVHLPSTHHIVASEKFAYLYDSRKNVQRWWNTISTRDSWQQVLRNMKSVEELEELEQQQLLLQQQQQQQWQAEPPPTSGYRNIRIDPGKQTGTESRTILVPPPSAGQKSKAQPTDLKVKSPLEAELKEDTKGVMSGDERFSTKRLRKMLEESEAAEPPPTSGGRNIRIDPRKQTGTESRTILVPPPSAGQQRLGKMFEENEAEEVKSQSTNSQAPEKEETPSVYKKPSDVQDRKSQADTVLADGKTGTPSTGTQAPDTPTSADERRATPPPKGEMARDDRGATEPRKPPSSNEQESQQRSEQEKMTSTDQRAAENMAVKDAQGETASQARHRGARDITKKAREADERREAELKEDTQGVMSGDERFSTKRLRKMLEESEAAEPPPTSGGRDIRIDPRKQTGTESRTILVPPPSAGQQRLGKMFEESEAAELKSQSTDSQAPEKEETPSVYKKPSDVQDRKSQADTVLADGKTGTPSTGTQAPDTPTSADERRATPPPKGEMARDDRGATEPRKPPSSNEQESQQRSEQEKMASQGAMSGDERFTTERLRRMLEESEAAALKSQSTDSQAPAKEETPSVHKKPSDVQDRKRQADTVLADGKTGTPLTGTQAPDTPTSADERRATPPPKGEMARDDRGATEPSKPPSSNEQESQQRSEQEKMASQGGDERFSTKRLRRMLEESQAAALKSQSTDSQAPAKEETPSVYKKPSDVQDRKSQADTVLAEGKTGTPSTGTQAPDTPTSADERRATPPPKGEMARDDRGATEPRKSPSSNEQESAPPVPSQSAPPSPIQQVSPAAPSIDELDKTAGVDRRAPPSTPKQTPTDARNALAPVQGAAPSADGISDKQSDKSTMDERALEKTPRQAPPSDTRHTSASIQGEIRVPRGPSDDMLGKTSGTGQIPTPAASKPTPTRGEVPDVHDTGDDATKKPAVDTKAAPTQQRQEPVLRSQQTTEQIKGVAPTSHGITGDELSKIAIADESATPPAPVQAPASDGRIASTALKGGILDARGKNEAVKPSVADPRGMLTTPRIPAPTPDTQRRTTSDQASDQAPPLPSFADTRNEKTDIAEAGRTNTIAPNEQPGGRIPKNAGAPAAGPSPMKSRKNMNETHKDEPSIQQLSSDQSRAQLAENKKQGDDATTLTEIGKPKENDFLANVNQNNTGQAQVASADGPSKLQMHSDQNKPISSEDIGKRTNEIVSYRSSATSREMPPSVPEKSMREKQLQGDKSSTSLQDNVKQGSEAALLESGTEQLKKRDLLANVDQNSGKTPGEALQKSEEQTSSDTQQVKSNTGNSKSDGSSKPTQFDGNKGNLPESQRRDSSTNP